MCRKESRRTEKALGAETLAYLIEVDTELQVFVMLPLEPSQSVSNDFKFSLFGDLASGLDFRSPHSELVPLFRQQK